MNIKACVKKALRCREAECSEKEQGELGRVSFLVSFMDDEGKTTEGKEELSAKNKDRRADNRKEEVRWGKVVRRRKENSSFVRFSHFLVRCLLPFLFSKTT